MGKYSFFIKIFRDIFKITYYIWSMYTHFQQIAWHTYTIVDSTAVLEILNESVICLKAEPLVKYLKNKIFDFLNIYNYTQCNHSCFKLIKCYQLEFVCIDIMLKTKR